LVQEEGIVKKLSSAAEAVIRNGSVKIRVLRSGMYQQMTFKVKRAKNVNTEYLELFIDRMIDTREIIRIAEEFGLPVEAQNGKAFPEGTTASDFQGP
jgi:hypothetical protein